LDVGPFTGKELDSETSLQYFGARYYMAALGRWGQVDPLADRYAGYSPYNYVLGNPNSLVDPDGRVAVPALLAACPWCVRAGIGFVGGVIGEGAAQIVAGEFSLGNLALAGGAGAAAGIVGGWGAAQATARVAVGRSSPRLAARATVARYGAQGTIGALTSTALAEEDHYKVAIIGGFFGAGGEALAGVITSRLAEEGADALLAAWRVHAGRLVEAGRAPEDPEQATRALQVILSAGSREIGADGGMGAAETMLNERLEDNDVRR
jgi:RHS repeat-associated protein